MSVMSEYLKRLQEMGVQPVHCMDFDAFYNHVHWADDSEVLGAIRAGAKVLFFEDYDQDHIQLTVELPDGRKRACTIEADCDLAVFVQFHGIHALNHFRRIAEGPWERSNTACRHCGAFFHVIDGIEFQTCLCE